MESYGESLMGFEAHNTSSSFNIGLPDSSAAFSTVPCMLLLCPIMVFSVCQSVSFIVGLSSSRFCSGLSLSSSSVALDGGVIGAVGRKVSEGSL